MEFVLDNGSIRVALSTAGGSFTSIAANGREYLWQGDPAVWSGQAPICFPICGGLRDGHATTMGGREVKLARHGFARKQEWKLEEQSDNMVALSLSSTDHAELLEQYPYPFKIVARYTIDSEKVAVSYEVTNEGTEDMPFFVAVEPWGGLSTCSDEDDILEHKRGCLVAKPGETVTRGFEIEIL